MEENNISQTETVQTIELTPTVKEDITVSAKWGRFFAILLYVLAVVMLGVIIFLAVGKTEEYDAVSTVLSTVTAVLCFIGAVIYVVFGYLLWKTTQNTLKGLEKNNQDLLAAGMHGLKRFMQLAGIITVVMLFVYFITIVASVLIGLAM
ncbi:MAG: hypothetical protein J6M30_06120 [Bacteroidales bacterium]|nr:hypothetical protein [Bacteroidales bacterium]